MKLIILFFSLVFSPIVIAKGNIETLSVITSGDIVKLFFSLLSVIVLVLLFSYLFTKLNGVSLGAKGHIQVKSTVSVGAKEKIMLISVGEEDMLVGVTTGCISLLSQVDPKKLQSTENPQSLPFSENLKKFLHRDSQ